MEDNFTPPTPTNQDLPVPIISSSPADKIWAKSRPVFLAGVMILTILIGWILISLITNLKSQTSNQAGTPTPSIVIPPGWQTYTNTQYQYAVSYPPQLQVDEEDVGERYLQAVFFRDPETQIGAFNVRVSGEGLRENLQYSREMAEFSSLSNLVDESQITVSGIRSFRIDSQSKLDIPGIVKDNSEILIPKGKFVYIISLDTNLINLVLPSFHFLDANQPTSTPAPSPTPTPIPSTSGCKIRGCSGELCLDESAEDIASICIYKDEYACYKYAVCEKQAGGSCAWTQTPEYQSCLKNLIN